MVFRKDIQVIYDFDKSGKYRQFSITIHNVDMSKCYNVVKEYVKGVKEYVMSVEPNPEGYGFHLHLFVQYKNQRYWSKVLKELNELKVEFLLPRPEGETRDWGRVQLDLMKGTFPQAEAYLKGETKDKPLGEVLKGGVKPCCRRFRKIGKNKYEECCGICWSNECMGCCRGCIFCNPQDPWYEGQMVEGYTFDEVVARMEKKNSQDRKKYLYI